MNESNKTDEIKTVTQHIYLLTGNDEIKTIDCFYSVGVEDKDDLPKEKEIADIHDLSNSARNPHSVEIIETTTSTDEKTQQEGFRRSIKRYFLENFKSFRSRDILTDDRYKQSSQFVRKEFMRCAIQFLCGEDDYHAKSLFNRDTTGE